MPELRIAADDAEQRLDRFLRKVLPGATLGHLHKLLRQGAVRVNGARAEGRLRLVEGDVVALQVGDDLFASLARRAVAAVPTSRRALEVVHRDEHLVVVVKPSGLALHPGSGVREHLLGAVQALVGTGAGLSFRVAPAHRLDRDTSGLCVFGVSARGLRGFTALLREGAVRKVYLAVVHGVPPAAATIDLPLLVEDGDGPPGVKTRVDPRGQRARTHYRRVADDGARSLLEVELDTGRTHQIRAHFADCGHALVGDRRYGRPDGAERLMLHAWRLQFVHPVTGVSLALEAPPPPEFAGYLRKRRRS